MRRLVPLLILTTLSLGCGRGYPANHHPVNGKVTLDDEPVGGVDVTFIPTADNQGPEARARTRPDGTYELATRDGKGAVSGKYRVVLSRWLRPDGSEPPRDVPPIESDAKETLPPSYSDPEKTVIRRTVPEGGAKFDFNLSKSGKAPQ